VLGMSGQDEGLEEDKEEGIVKALENGLHKLYRRR
jgi:hypothetical protein